MQGFQLVDMTNICRERRSGTAGLLYIVSYFCRPSSLRLVRATLAQTQQIPGNCRADTSAGTGN